MIRAERHVEAEMDVCGGITVFLSLILTCICALMGGLFESARAAGSGWYMQMALNSSLDSLMSCYHREIWDKYRIFVLECADKERLAAEMEPQMETYLAAAPFYPVSGGKAGLNYYQHFVGDDPTMEGLVRHVEHFLELDGERSLCLGGDMDGCELLAGGMRGLEDVPLLWQALADRGYPQSLLEDLFWNNLRRLI